MFCRHFRIGLPRRAVVREELADLFLIDYLASDEIDRWLAEDANAGGGIELIHGIPFPQQVENGLAKRVAPRKVILLIEGGKRERGHLFPSYPDRDSEERGQFSKAGSGQRPA